ncbi:MAG TPA: peptidylprolyl isomerase [Polyangiaceae bacterium]|nr:peptidylprolyl isomerase [Polyangiaceae bacterium]
MIRHLLLGCWLATGCVVTTIEGPAEGPRITPRPEQTKASVSEETTAPAEALGPKSIAARHLLVSYAGAMRAGATVTRTKEEAQKRAEEALGRARAGEDFEKLVAEYSDEPGAADRGGDLGTFERDKMVKQFSDAAFKLNPGELSAVVETPFGFHVIQRTE